MAARRAVEGACAGAAAWRSLAAIPGTSETGPVMTLRASNILNVLLLALMVAFCAAEARAQLSLPDTEFLEDVKNGRRDNVARSLVRGQSANTSDSQGRTAMIVAAVGGHIDIIELLVENKGNIRLKDRQGQSPMYWAAGSGHPEVVEMLIKLGAPVNDPNRQGTTPLMVAARRGYEEIVRMLLAAKADVNATDHTGRTALMWAAETRNQHVPQILKKAGAR